MAYFHYAAGLFFVLLVSSGEVYGLSSLELRKSFQARSLARSRHRHQVFTPRSPLRYRSRRSPARISATNNTGFELEPPTPPRLVHPNQYEDVGEFVHARNDSSVNVTDLPFFSTYPVTDDANSTRLQRYGRTSAESGRVRPISPYLDQISVDDDEHLIGWQEFRLVPREAAPAGVGGFVLEAASKAPEVVHQKRNQHFFEALAQAPLAKSSNNNSSADSCRAVPTWQGQPSAFRPRKPYQPSLNTTGDYGNVISKSLWFYQVQRSGLLQQSPRPIWWRNDSGLKDGCDNNVDLTGGYYDAGDYLKFTFPLSSAISLLAWGSTEHWRGLVKSSNLGYLDETLRWGLDWMIKAHPDKDTLYVQVGNGDVDNDYWGGDQTIPTPRPSYFVNRNKPGTDASAGAASAFAAAAIFYSSVAGDKPYAETLLSHALSLYYFAESAPRTLYQKSVPAVKEWYASSDYSDELVLAGLMLYRATSNAYFLRRAELYFNKYKVGENRDPVDWDSKHGLAMLLGAQLVQQNNVTSAIDWNGNLAAYLDEVAMKAGKTPAGLLYWSGSSNDNSLPPAVGTSYILAEYARLFPQSDRAARYSQLASSQMDYVFGNNPKNITYVVGVGSRSPKNPQSAMASGGHDIGNIDHSPEKMAHILFGGMVGGPAKDDTFQDRRSNYRQSECALDYNAPLTILMASEHERGRLPFFLRQQK